MHVRTNVTMWRVRVTIVAVVNKYHIFSVCVCSLRYPACNTHAPYCHLWPAPLYNIFPHYLINSTIFFWGGEELLNIKCDTDFLYNRRLEHFSF